MAGKPGAACFSNFFVAIPDLRHRGLRQKVVFAAWWLVVSLECRSFFG